MMSAVVFDVIVNESIIGEPDGAERLQKTNIYIRKCYTYMQNIGFVCTNQIAAFVSAMH